MASTSYANTDSYVYDVFINHRGPDCKETLATYLYDRLTKHGLRVFLDKPELEPGDGLIPQIEGAIRSASVHIAIFSPKYAESSWCLKELVLMFESRKPIIPVFYGVQPSELRWTQEETGLYDKVLRLLPWLPCMLCCTRGENGVYARSLRELEEKTTIDHQTGQKKPRYDSVDMKEWRLVLSNVAGISGFDLESYNGDEQQLLEKVVDIGVVFGVQLTTFFISTHLCVELALFRVMARNGVHNISKALWNPRAGCSFLRQKVIVWKAY